LPSGFGGLPENTFIARLIPATTTAYYEKGRNDTFYPDKQEEILALIPELMNNTKSIEAEFKIEVWYNALNGQKLHDKTCKHTFLSTTAGYGIDVNASGLKEIQAIFTLTKWLVTKK